MKMVQLICSPRVREKLSSELVAAGIPVDGDDTWALVERGHESPEGKLVIVFDALDYMEVVRLLVSGLREDGGGRRLLTGQLGNIVHVKEIVPWFNSRYVLRLVNGDELEVSKTYAKRLRSALSI